MLACMEGGFGGIFEKYVYRKTVQKSEKTLNIKNLNISQPAHRNIT